MWGLLGILDTACRYVNKVFKKNMVEYGQCLSKKKTQQILLLLIFQPKVIQSFARTY